MDFPLNAEGPDVAPLSLEEAAGPSGLRLAAQRRAGSGWSDSSDHAGGSPSPTWRGAAAAPPSALSSGAIKEGRSASRSPRFSPRFQEEYYKADSGKPLRACCKHPGRENPHLRPFKACTQQWAAHLLPLLFANIECRRGGRRRRRPGAAGATAALPGGAPLALPHARSLSKVGGCCACCWSTPGARHCQRIAALPPPMHHAGRACVSCRTAELEVNDVEEGGKGGGAPDRASSGPPRGQGNGPPEGGAGARRR
jgi:hypothetical protein